MHEADDVAHKWRQAFYITSHMQCLIALVNRLCHRRERHPETIQCTHKTFTGFAAELTELVLQEKEALAREVEHLNSTVFSKTFKAPSAWAEREVKYKMEKRDWDSEGRKLRELVRKVEAENAAYRASNKTAEFEARIEVRPLPSAKCRSPFVGRPSCIARGNRSLHVVHCLIDRQTMHQRYPQWHCSSLGFSWEANLRSCGASQVRSGAMMGDCRHIACRLRAWPLRA